MTFAVLRHLGRTQAARRLYSTASAESYLAEREAIREHAEHASALWHKVSIAAIPVLFLATYNAHRLMVEHEEHEKHHPAEHIKYSYLMIRNKASILY
ncbi:cytochrome c oxidase, subunit VIa [Syncephalis plumigaleata]|nr:cytochrome c oxidase, subunit VIa [Syncephalis plumigaleata]